MIIANEISNFLCENSTKNKYNLALLTEEEIEKSKNFV